MRGLLSLFRQRRSLDRAQDRQGESRGRTRRNSAEHAKKLQHKLAMLRRTFECESCFRCFGSAEALTEHKIDSKRLAAERAQGNELDPQTLKALTELKRNAERVAEEHAQQEALSDELSLQTLSLQPPTDDRPWSMYPDLHESVSQRPPLFYLGLACISRGSLPTADCILPHTC
jgi:hypothetical protein